MLFRHLYHPHAPIQHVWNPINEYNMNPIRGVCAIMYSRIRNGICSVTPSCVFWICSDSFRNCVLWSEDLNSRSRSRTSLSRFVILESSEETSWELGRRDVMAVSWVSEAVLWDSRRVKRFEMDLARRSMRVLRSRYSLLEGEEGGEG